MRDRVWKEEGRRFNQRCTASVKTEILLSLEEIFRRTGGGVVRHLCVKTGVLRKDMAISFLNAGAKERIVF